MEPSQDKLRKIIPQISPVPGIGPLDAATVLEAHLHPAATSIRINPRKPAMAFTDLDSVPWNSEGFYLQERPVFTLDPLFHAGTYYVQEASSMFTGHAFKSLVQRGDKALRVLDLCAAPGGKSTLMASMLQDDDLLISNEVIQPRASILAENLSRWGQMNTWVTNSDPAAFAGLPQYFDVILIDAPCTGSGLWRKDEDALDEWSADHVKLCSERQKRILADALPALKEGGLLLYATCSYSAEENETIADWICDTMDMTPQPVSIQPEWQITVTHSPVHQAAGYRFYPWKLKGEGFFLSAFRKNITETEDAAPERRKKDKHKGHQKNGNSRVKDETERWKPWLDTDFKAIVRNEEYYAIHPEHQADFDLLLQQVRIKKTGTALGKIMGKDIIPDHELALSIHRSPNIPIVDLSKDEALSFLKKEEVAKDNPLKGWQIATFQGQSLGWGKWLPNRMNNYLPKNWRIRMDIR